MSEHDLSVVCIKSRFSRYEDFQLSVKKVVIVQTRGGVNTYDHACSECPPKNHSSNSTNIILSQIRLALFTMTSAFALTFSCSFAVAS
jgi:hypothetical protein